MAADEWDGDLDVLSDPEEQAHLYSVLDSFRQFRRVAHYNVTHTRRQSFYALPAPHWELLSKPPFSILDTLSQVDDAIDANATIAEAILETGVQSMGIPTNPAGSNNETNPPVFHGKARKLDLDKARSTINQLYRDWSTDGEKERIACYNPIVKDVTDYFPAHERARVKILVPGAGLGRLVFDLCCQGFDVEGNEVSYHQLLTSAFILNHTTQSNEYPLYPWVWTFSNVDSRKDQLREVMIPDIHPQTCNFAGGSMNMTAGDFCTIYGDEQYNNSFDVVAAVFFIDTAPNLITYLVTMRTCLKPGGLLINLGPLLWHFEGIESRHDKEQSQNGVQPHTSLPAGGQTSQNLKIGEAGSVELSGDEVIKLVETFGFDIVTGPEWLEETTYVGNERSLLQNIYRPYHWIAKKQ